MAFEIGTATSAADLYAKLQTFLKTNADLVTASQEWTEVWNGTTVGTYPDDVMLAGPGLGGTSQVLVGMRLFQDVAQDRYHIRFSGATGVIPSSDRYSAHVNSTSEHVYMPLDAGAMDYWFVANGQRFVVVVKISTVFEAAYCGFFLPYSDPLSYPYPMFIGGSAGDWSGSAAVRDWRDASLAHTHFIQPRYESDVNTFGTSAQFLKPDGVWARCEYWDYYEDSATGIIGPATHNGIWENPGENDAIFNTWYLPRHLYGRMRDCFGGDFALWNMSLTDRQGPTNLGVLDGVYFSQQFQNFAENTVTIGGVDHLVVQNVFRTEELDYWALALE